MPRRVLALPLFIFAGLLLPLTGCGGDNLAAPSVAAELAPTQVAAAIALKTPQCPAAPTALQKISSVQSGSRSTAPIGQQVTLRGVVTANFQASNQLHGIFIQQATTVVGARSDGLFIYLPLRSKPVTLGSFVQVSGTIDRSKNREGRSDGQLRLVTSNDVTVCGAGPSITPRNLNLPVADMRQLDALDGMLVRLPQPLTVSDNHDLGYNGELVLSADDRQWQAYNHPLLHDPAAIIDLNQRSRLILANGSTATYPAPLPYLSATDASGTRRVGDTATNVEGILTKSFGVWRLQPTRPPVFNITNARSEVPPVVGGTVRLASMNVLSYFTTLNQRGASSAIELKRQRDKLVATIRALDADAIGLMEIENSSDALQNLVDAINTEIGSTEFAAIDAPVIGSDAIKVAIIYKPARVTPIGAAQSPPSTRSDGGIGVSRPPVAQRFAQRDSGKEFWLVVNHLKSKSRCPTDPASADQDTGQGCWNATRVRQASATARWVATLGARHVQPHIVLLGDFNAYLEEAPIRTLVAGGFEDLLLRLPAAERYSYVFDGRAGALDHIFVDASLRDKVSGVAIWHSNADEPAVLDYHTDNKPDDRYAATPFRASDHDPLLLGLNL